jgi:uncharacterized membrane protein
MRVVGAMDAGASRGASVPKAAAVSGGLVLGLGLGGFIDGIFLHQIAQWHNMLSAVLPPISMEAMMRNMRWDGVFHVATLVATFIGVLLLWQAAEEPRRRRFGYCSGK